MISHLPPFLRTRWATLCSAELEWISQLEIAQLEIAQLEISQLEIAQLEIAQLEIAQLEIAQLEGAEGAAAGLGAGSS